MFLGAILLLTAGGVECNSWPTILMCRLCGMHVLNSSKLPQQIFLFYRESVYYLSGRLATATRFVKFIYLMYKLKYEHDVLYDGTLF